MKPLFVQSINDKRFLYGRKHQLHLKGGEALKYGVCSSRLWMWKKEMGWQKVS